MDDALALEKLRELVSLIDDFEELRDRRWGYGRYQYKDENMAEQLRADRDLVLARTRFARDVVSAMGEADLAAQIVDEGDYHGSGHGFKGARTAIVEACGVLEQSEELIAVTGPLGPRMAASELHPYVWSAAAKLWDDGHYRQAVGTAASALEGQLQTVAAPGTSGVDLAGLFSIKNAEPGRPRLRLKGVDDPDSLTWRSAHEGAGYLVRGAFQGVRNLMQHPGWPDPEQNEALEMLAVLSYVARLVDRSDSVEF